MIRKAIFSLVLAFLPLLICSDVIKSTIAKKQIEIAENAPAFDNPYITDGLVAMYDGEWNAGYYKHSDSVKNWFDLSGNKHALHAPDPIWYDNHCYYDGKSDKIFRGTAAESGWLRDILASNYFTIEFVVSYDKQYATQEMYLCCSGEGAGLFMRRNSWNNSTSAIEFFPQDSGRKYLAVPQTQSIMTCRLTVDDNMLDMICYVDSQVYSTKYSDILPIPMSNNYGWAFGYRADMYGSSVIRSADQRVYRIAIYNRPLTEDELMYNQEIDKERFGL